MRPIPLILLILVPIIIPAGSLAEATAGRSTACTGTLCISEIMANSLDSGERGTYPEGEWVEVWNPGPDPVDILGWGLRNQNGRELLISASSLVGYDETNASTHTLPADGYAIVARNGASTFSIANGGDRILLIAPDGTVTHNATYAAADQEGTTLIPTGDGTSDWVHASAPTPGAPGGVTPLVTGTGGGSGDTGNTNGSIEPSDSDNNGSIEASEHAGLRFLRVSINDGSETEGTGEAIALSHESESTLHLEGLSLRRTTASTQPVTVELRNRTLAPSEILVLASEPTIMADLMEGTIVGMDEALASDIHLPDTGFALQLMSGDIVLDALVIGTGPVTIDGWSGPSVPIPESSASGLVFLREDGCPGAADTDRTEDWLHRWTHLGSGAACGSTRISGVIDARPFIGPEVGIGALLTWIDGATTSLEGEIYHLHDGTIVDALVEAEARGVEVRIVLEDGAWWTGGQASDRDRNQQAAAELAAGGAEVLWMVAPEDRTDPYRNMHSKALVRDGESSFISSGNLKSTSLPSDGSGNREWSMIVDNVTFAHQLQNVLEWDLDPNRPHLRAWSSNDGPDRPTTLPRSPSARTPLPDSVVGAGELELLTCPDDCLSRIVAAMDAANEEILLSLQELDTTWSWGWNTSENPLVMALERAGERGVRLRMSLNAHYLDAEEQAALDLMNGWHRTHGWDVAAALMAENETVVKNHNKGMIVDGTTVLVGSMNWNADAMLRNRELGLLITGQQFAAPYLDAWWTDWNRTSSDLDSDQDGTSDGFELTWGLDRSNPTIGAGTDDPDEDGLTNSDEERYGSNPLDADTDDDCISDGREVEWITGSGAFAGTEADDAARRALVSMDGDEDGRPDHQSIGCDTTAQNGTDVPTATLDADGDGVPDALEVPECRSTVEGAPVNAEGCSRAQRAALAAMGNEAGSNRGGILAMVALIAVAGMVLIAVALPSRTRTEEEEHPEFPGWPERTVRKYIQLGWSLQDLRNWYHKDRS